MIKKKVDGKQSELQIAPQMQSQTIGYHLQGKQTELQLILEVDEHLNPIDFNSLDLCLNKVFAIKPSWIETQSSSNVINLVARAITIGLELMRASKIPIFDPGRIMHSQAVEQASKKRWKIKVGLPWIDHLPVALASLVLQFSLNIIRETLQKHSKISNQNIDDIRLLTEKNVIRKITSVLDMGISTLPILHAAWKYKIPFRHVGGGIFLLGCGAKSRIIHRSSIDSDTALGSSLASNKALTSQALRLAGLPCPVHIRIETYEQAQIAAKNIGWPLVIKPNDRERSEGVTVGIDNFVSLDSAYKNASIYSKSILVEKQVTGTCYRLMIGNGRFLYALWRKPISILGNGKDNIWTLLESHRTQANSQPPWYRKNVISLDAETLLVLSSQGLDENSVPANGQKVLLRFIESTRWGEDLGDATTQTHADNVDLAERAARVLGLANAGVDIISEDISIPWYLNKAVINEVNYAPHFGATDVARSIMPHYVDQLMHGDGRIPIEIFIGEHLAWEAALKCQQAWIQSGLHAWITSDEQTLNHHGSKVILASSLSFQRTLALLRDKQVEAIAIVIRDDQWLNSGAPVNKIDAWHNYMDKQSSLKIKELTHFLSNLMSP